MKKELLSILFLLSFSLGVFYLVSEKLPLDNDEISKETSMLENINENKIEYKSNVENNSITFDIIRVSPDGDTVMAGQSEPNVKIYLYENKKVISSFFADPNGEWIWISDNPLSHGLKVFSIKFIDKLGNDHWSSQEIYILDDKSSKLKPKVIKMSSHNYDDFHIYNQDYFDNGITLDVLNYNPKKKFSISGRAPSDSKIKIFNNGILIATTESDYNGYWKYSSKFINDIKINLNITTKINGKNLIIEFPLNLEERISDFEFNDSVKVVMDNKGIWRISRKINDNEFMYSEIFNDNFMIANILKSPKFYKTFTLAISK